MLRPKAYVSGGSGTLDGAQVTTHRLKVIDYEDLGDVDDVPMRVPASDGYRTCSVYGSDCEPDNALSADGTGVRIAFVCPVHGVQGIVDPFSDRR